MDIETQPVATWAVFTINSPTGLKYVPEAYARVVTEWLPSSPYKRDGAAPSLEVFPDGDANAADYRRGIWMPILSK